MDWNSIDSAFDPEVMWAWQAISILALDWHIGDQLALGWQQTTWGSQPQRLVPNTRYSSCIRDFFYYSCQKGKYTFYLVHKYVVMDDQSSTDAIRNNWFCQKRKKSKHRSHPCAFPHPLSFFSYACFCVKFLGQNFVLAQVLMRFARLIFMANWKDNNCIHFL